MPVKRESVTISPRDDFQSQTNEFTNKSSGDKKDDPFADLMGGDLGQSKPHPSSV
jgi:hypothetical protein